MSRPGILILLTTALASANNAPQNCNTSTPFSTSNPTLPPPSQATAPLSLLLPPYPPATATATAEIAAAAEVAATITTTTTTETITAYITLTQPSTPLPDPPASSPFSLAQAGVATLLDGDVTSKSGASTGGAVAVAAPLFTLDPAFAESVSVSGSRSGSGNGIVPFEGHYTAKSTSMSMSTPVTTPPLSPPSNTITSTTTTTTTRLSHPHAPSYNAPPAPTTTADDEENDTAWSGVDDALSAQFQDTRYHPTPRMGGMVLRGVMRGGGGGRRRGRGGGEKQGDCQACGEEGKAVCRGDVAVGVCKGGVWR